ncbi:MAG: polysaccharide lyase family 8 super-sandwich domain-containing protein, partial [Sphingobacterium sp.]
QKAWFFFDKEIVCLGSGINCSAAEPVVTTLNQTWLNGPVVWNGKEQMSTDSLVRNVKQGEYVMHNQVGYYFPEAMKIALTAKEQSGSWYRINRSRSKDAVHGKVFKLWVEHAAKPVNGSYAYIVVPGVDQIDKRAMQQLKIWHNTPAIQAVEHLGLAAIQAVFYESGTYQIGAWSIQVDKPVILQITKGNSVFKLDVADPLQQEKAVRIHLINKRAKVNQTVEIKLPQAEYAGSTSSETIPRGNK